MAEEDRISNLPDDIIHNILCFLDLKYAMQTSALSKKWKLVWTLLPKLNLDSYKFSSIYEFNKFVKHALSHRNNLREVSALELRCRGLVTNYTFKRILNYAELHNFRRLNLVWTATKHHEFPQFLFSFRALEDLTLEINYTSDAICYISQSGWDFPVLEKLNLRNFDIDVSKNKRINLFSKCVKLKDLTLNRIEMCDLEELSIFLPQLCNLTIIDRYYYSCPNVVNVVAPQLENVTAPVEFIHVLHSVEGFDSLVKVDLSWRVTTEMKWNRKFYVSRLLGVFQKLYNVKFLILDVNITELLSSYLKRGQMLLEPCPFNNLKYLKMNTMLWVHKHLVVPVELKNYFLDKSPSVTFIADYPQNVHDDAETKVPDTMLEEKVPMQDQVTTKKQKVIMFDTEIEMQYKVVQKRTSQRLKRGPS